VHICQIFYSLVLAKLLAVEMDKNHQTLEEATTAPETFTTPWEKEHIMTSTDTLLSEDALARLLQDILKIQKINRRTNKKGTSKGCFGVKLDRIGSVSGLGLQHSIFTNNSAKSKLLTDL
uniref:Uncharacterized protein n=1 Tax=Erpetoichthys calabaricus TaxID=27687 RepID=A0A8C4RYR4_ERPCA